MQSFAQEILYVAEACGVKTLIPVNFLEQNFVQQQT